MNFQDIIMSLQKFWAGNGCLIWQPYDLEKGAGTFNLYGSAAEYYGDVNLSSGTLNLGSDTHFNARNFIVQGGTLKMDNDPALITAATFGADADSVIKLGIYTDGTNDKIEVAETAVIDAKLQVTAQLGVYNTQNFNLITAADLSGALINDIEAGGASGLALFDGTKMIGDYHWLFDFENNSVILNIVKATVQSDFAGITQTANEQALASALDALSAYSTGSLKTVITDLLALPRAAQASAVASMSPYFLANVVQSRGLTNDYKEIYPRLENYDEVGNALGESLWAQVKTSGMRFKADANSLGEFSANNYGALFGYDSFITENVLLGLYGSYNKAAIAQQRSSGEITSLGLGLYGGLVKSKWEVLSLITAGVDNYETKREVGFINQKAESSFDGYNFGFDIQGVYKTTLGAFNLRPFLGVENKISGYNSFKEKGADALNQHVQSGHAFASALRLGAGIGKEYSKFGWYLNLESKYLLSGNTAEITSSLQDTEINFKTVSAETDKLLYGAGLGANYKINKRWQAYANASASLSQRYNGYYANLGIRYTFGLRSHDVGEYPRELLPPELQEALSGEAAVYDRSLLPDVMRQALSSTTPDYVQLRVNVSNALFAKHKGIKEIIYSLIVDYHKFVRWGQK